MIDRKLYFKCKHNIIYQYICKIKIKNTRKNDKFIASMDYNRIAIKLCKL